MEINNDEWREILNFVIRKKEKQKYTGKQFKDLIRE